jgi:AraC family transcriptional regulator of arabinose operon
MSLLLSGIDRMSAGEVVYPPGGRLGPRWQHDLELVLLHTGSARITVDEQEPIVLRPVSVALLLPGHRETFEFDARRETHHSWAQLGVAGAVPDQVVRAPRVLPASTALTELVRDAVSAARTPSATAEQLTAALAVAAIWRYVAEAESRAEGRPAAVELARSYLDRHLTDAGVSLEQVAAAAHVTPAHLVRRFRAELGITPMAYLWERRVATGVDLLTNTGLPVGEVARRAGFRSVYHFSRRVKEATGLPPTELRRRGWSHRFGAVTAGVSRAR